MLPLNIYIIQKEIFEKFKKKHDDARRKEFRKLIKKRVE
jgi:hypothetical protein